ncbi:hypothetical protein PRIPAC_87253 [Pristionchus pacificus]|uniref:Uncharacterized protein n=1 Tax=Pristionchus pacificus TaxID=54126 RepID=A0A2A6CWS5_PRIPA|nr:hypothetical protein PRIPAC_87253 [Pristionchus pacificus]|eukprot:PDM82483.1 hypothetical protein PRIPAC_36876 [Pristionchus pacificus]
MPCESEKIIRTEAKAELNTWDLITNVINDKEGNDDDEEEDETILVNRQDDEEIMMCMIAHLKRSTVERRGNVKRGHVKHFSNETCNYGRKCVKLHQPCPNDSHCYDLNCPYEHYKSHPESMRSYVHVSDL